MLEGRRALVTGRESGIGREIARGVAELGATLTVDAPVDVVVHADIDVAALAPQALADTAADDWNRRCEAVLRSALDCAQSAHRMMRERGGLLIFVTPTIGITGAAELVPYATAIEGIRAMAKSAARQWGQHGIRVNCVAPATETLAPGELGLGPDVAEPALGAVPTDADALVSAVSLLAGPGSVVTGATIVVDGGVVMAP